MTTTKQRRLDALRDAHTRRRDAIRKRLNDFAIVPGREYYYELVYCLLTPQSSAINAARAVDRLREADRLGDFKQTASILARRDAYIRFHHTKARNIAEARGMFPVIAEQLAGRGSPEDLRLWLVENVRGLGWKEASHFLRNIGRRNLAIFDRHILKHLHRHGVIRAVPISLTPARYLAIERAFLRFSARVGIPMDELDLLFWSEETGEILK